MIPAVLSIHADPPITQCAIIDEAGNILSQTEIPHDPPGSPSSHFEELIPILEGLLESVNQPIKLQAVGVNSISLNIGNDKLDSFFNLARYHESDLVDELKSYGELPVFVGHPAICYAWGEKYYGAAKETEHYMSLYLGDVIKVCFMEEEIALSGHNGMAGNLGDVLIEIPGLNLIYGGPERLSTYATTTGLKHITSDLMAKYQDNSPLQHKGFDDMTCMDIIGAAKEGDKMSLDALERMGIILGKALSDLVALSSPSIIYLSGPLSKASEFIAPIIQKTIEKHVFGVFKGKTKVSSTQLLEDDADLKSAAALAWHQIKVEPIT